MGSSWVCTLAPPPYMVHIGGLSKQMAYLPSIKVCQSIPCLENNFKLFKTKFRIDHFALSSSTPSSRFPQHSLFHPRRGFLLCVFTTSHPEKRNQPATRFGGQPGRHVTCKAAAPGGLSFLLMSPGSLSSGRSPGAALADGQVLWPHFCVHLPGPVHSTGHRAQASPGLAGLQHLLLPLLRLPSVPPLL